MVSKLLCSFMASSFANNASNSNSTQSTPSSATTMADKSANNPYFLPATGSPGIVLTSQPLTGSENYMSWARSVFLASSAINKFGFVNGSIPEPDPSSPLFNTWSRYNTTILSWLTNSLGTYLKARVMYINTIKDLWIDLRDRLSQGNTPRLFKLQKEISHLSQGSLRWVLISPNLRHFGMNSSTTNLSLCALVLVLVDQNLLNWMLSIKNMCFIS